MAENWQFNETELFTVRQQWDRIVHYPADCFGLKLFLSLLDLHPEYCCLFGFSPENRENFQNDQRLRAHGINVVYMLNMIFDNLDDADMIRELLFKLVRMHLVRGIDKTWFDDIVQPFEYVLQYFNNKVKLDGIDLLRKAFLFVKNEIQNLYDQSLSEILLLDQQSSNFSADHD